MSDEEPAGGPPDDAPPEDVDKNKDRDKNKNKDGGRDREKEKGGEKGRDGKPSSDEGKPDSDAESTDNEADDKESERERAAGRLREHTRNPLAEEESEDGPTDLAAASRAHGDARMLFSTGRDLHTFDRPRIGRVYIGDTYMQMDARRSGTGIRSGPVPADELRELRRAHVAPDGYVRLRNALGARRLLVLGAAPGTGRTSTALSLLDDVTNFAVAEANRNADTDADTGTDTGTGTRIRTATEPPADSRVWRVDPDDGVRQLADSLGGEEVRPGTGYLLELSLTGPGVLPPDEIGLDRLAAALAGCRAFAVIVVTVGSAANPLLAGRYGMLCPPAPTQELLTTRLRERLEDRADAAADDSPPTAELLARAEELAEREEVRDAVGLADLRPVEAELFASLLAGHVLETVSYKDLLDGCRSLAAGQAQEWFAGVDRALAARPADTEGTTGQAAVLFHPVAFRIALAVLGGASHSAVASAAHLLTWELSVQCDPDNAPARPLFCDDPDSDLALSRAELKNGLVEVAGAEVAARLIWYRGSALPAAVLTEVWDRHFPARAPVVRWLRLLADDPRPQVWMRAAVAAGELCVQDFDHGYAELVRPLAEASTARRRFFAATMMDQAAGHASHRKAVRKLVDDWGRYGTNSLRWSAAMALGYGNAAATTDDALDALARIGVRDEGEQMAVASLNVVRLLALPDGPRVLRRMTDWTRHKYVTYQDLGLVTAVRLMLTSVDEVLFEASASPLGERDDRPLALALAASRPELVGPMADLMWTALNTARSRDVAMDALESLLRSAVRKNRSEGARLGLAALLPVLMAEEQDRRRLDWLLRRMMNDPENRLPDAQARALWWLAVPARGRAGEEERNG
ncbi:hypothetical protein [Streptomyces sp. NPDC048669]|uniref:hypothetical protein n=1 Tax=Streptomyces sp. NPDC048669 TaxID=3155267 RepID=UPI0034342976